MIVVGDSKQLPPTNFFRRSTEDDPDDDDDEVPEDSLQGMDSILDAMKGFVGQGLVGEEHLRVHYRARSQSLIQFSNHQFYKEK